MLLVGAFAFLTLFISSCSKNEYNNVSPNNQLTQEKFMKKVKGMNFVLNTKNGGKVVVNASGKVQSLANFNAGAEGGVNFNAGAEGGTNFSSGESNTNFAAGGSSTTYNSGAGSSTNYNTISGFSLGGGSFSIGGEEVTLDYVFCSEDDSTIMDAFSEFGEGFKVIIGIKGNFESEESARIDYLYVMVLIGDEPSGNYKLDIGLLEGEGEMPTGKFGLIQIIDLTDVDMGMGGDIEEGKIYFSLKGNVAVGGGTYTYSAADFAEITFGNGGDIDISNRTKGSGTLLCQ